MPDIYVFQKNKYRLVFLVLTVLLMILVIRLFYFMIFASRHLSDKARDVEQRERTIKAARG